MGAVAGSEPRRHLARRTVTDCQSGPDTLQAAHTVRLNNRIFSPKLNFSAKKGEFFFDGRGEFTLSFPIIISTFRIYCKYFDTDVYLSFPALIIEKTRYAMTFSSLIEFFSKSFKNVCHQGKQQQRVDIFIKHERKPF